MKKAKKFSAHTDALASDWENIKDAFADTAEDVTEMADDIQPHITDYAEKNPMLTLAIALAAGLVIGWCLKK